MTRLTSSLFACALLLVAPGCGGPQSTPPETRSAEPASAVQVSAGGRQQRLTGKMQRVNAGIGELRAQGRDARSVAQLLFRYRELMQAGKPDQAEEILDRALRAIDVMQRDLDQKPSFAGRMAYGDVDADRRKQIFLVDGQTGSRRQVTHDDGGNWQPSLSPDGRRIAYTARLAGMEIRRIDTDGTNRRVLAGQGRGKIGMAPAWSPDGSRIAYMAGKCKPRPVGCLSHIWVMDQDGGNKRQLTSGPESDGVPTWSPDGARIAFFSHRDGGLAQIWVVDASGQNLKRLTRAYRDEKLGANIEQKVPAWSPDGRHIAYWWGVEMDDPRTTGEVPRDIWIMEPDGSNQRKLVSGDAPAWSPDGQTVIYPVNRPLERTGLPIGVGAVSLDGSNKRVLFYCNGYFGRASWVRSASSASP